jgi:hypothetical protein
VTASIAGFLAGAKAMTLPASGPRWRTAVMVPLEEAADLACFTRPRRNKPLLQPGFAGRPGSPEPRPFPGIGDRQAIGTGSAGNMDLEKRAVKGRKGAY